MCQQTMVTSSAKQLAVCSKIWASLVIVSEVVRLLREREVRLPCVRKQYVPAVVEG